MRTKYRRGESPRLMSSIRTLIEYGKGRHDVPAGVADEWSSKWEALCIVMDLSSTLLYSASPAFKKGNKTIYKESFTHLNDSIARDISKTVLTIDKNGFQLKLPLSLGKNILKNKTFEDIMNESINSIESSLRKMSTHLQDRGTGLKINRLDVIDAESAHIMYQKMLDPALHIIPEEVSEQGTEIIDTFEALKELDRFRLSDSNIEDTLLYYDFTQSHSITPCRDTSGM